MTKKLRLLLLDANVVIYLHELGLWEQVTGLCDVHLARTVAGEALYYDSPAGSVQIDLSQAEAQRLITIVDALPEQTKRFVEQFDPVYAEALDPGERESLAILMSASEEYRICSGDKIVFLVLAQFNRAEQGISLEEVLKRIGRTRPLPYPMTLRFRQHWNKQGEQDRIRGIGRKSNR